jgi:hypothetical protein
MNQPYLYKWNWIDDGIRQRFQIAVIASVSKKVSKYRQIVLRVAAKTFSCGNLASFTAA